MDQLRSTPSTNCFSEMLLSNYESYVSDQYQNYSQNMIFYNIFQVFEKQKKFTSRATKDFANAFTKQITKLIKVVKVRKEKQKTMSFQLLAPLNKPKFWSFPNKNGISKKMTDIKVAVAAKANQL